MQSFFKKYHDYRRKKQIHAIVYAFVLALGANIVIFSPIGGNLQASISQAGEQKFQANLTAIQKNNSIDIEVLTELTDVTSIHTTLLYNPEGIKISNIQSSIGEVVELSNTAPHILTIDYNPSQKLENKEVVLTIEYTHLNKTYSPISFTDTFMIDTEETKTHLSIEK